MAQELVPAENAKPIRRQRGSQVTLVNQSAVDVYFDFNPNRLNATPVGVAPSGTKLLATTGSIQIDSFPGVIWVRAATPTQIEVQP